MAKQTPRLRLQELHEREKTQPDGFYGVNYAFINSIEFGLKTQATKIMKSVNQGWGNSREVREQIYQLLLDGVPVKEIKSRLMG